MREETGGSGIVTEIGHFLAHPKGRTQGIATREIRDIILFLKFRTRLERSLILPSSVPTSLPDVLRGNLRRMRGSTLKRKTGVTPRRAKDVLEQILSRMTPSSHGALRKPTLQTDEEFAVFMCVGNNMKGGPLFTDDDLLKDFKKVAIEIGVIKKSEEARLAAVRPAMALFALTAMHNCEIDLGDKTSAIIAISTDDSGNLGAFAVAEVLSEHHVGGPSRVAAWLFATSLPASTYCEPGVVPTERGLFVGDFEITAQQKLGRLP
jgi:hypothetical protein